MNIKVVSVALVAVMVGAVMFGALIPIFDDVTATEDTFTNEGYFTYDPITSDSDVTLTWEKANPGVISVGEKSLTMPEGAGSWTIVGSENFTLRYYRNATVSGVQMYSNVGYISVNSGGSYDTATITISETQLVITDGTNTRTVSIGTHGFVLNVDGNGPLTLKTPTDSAYILDDSEIYLCGTTFVTGSGTNDFVGVFGYGTVNEVTLSSFYGNTGNNTVSFGTPVINAVAVDSHVDLYQISNVVFPLTQNSATVTATYSYFVVPTEVTAERAVHVTESEGAIMDLIPLIIGLGLVLMTVAFFLRKKL